MRTKFIICILSFIPILLSCETETRHKFGFNSEIQTDSRGLVIMDANHNATSIFLNGNIRLDEGRIYLELIRPNGKKAISNEIIAPAIITFDEVFAAQPGYWSLKYRSENGKGIINLHLSH